MKNYHYLLAITVALSSVVANAELYQAGPISAAAGNFPIYYQDKEGLALDLCLPSAGIELNQGLCLLTEPDIPNAAQPISFPDNFPGEAFWWNGGSTLTTGDGGKAILVMALEAAFANEEPIPGDQVVFARIRFRFIAPTTGHYTVTHPYGKKELDAVAGERVFVTDDVGVLCGLDFTCAAKDGAIGPFLRPALDSGDAPLDPVVIDGKTYIADPAVETLVTGSPFGTNTFKIQGPDIGGPGVNELENPFFTLMGRVHTNPLPSNINIEQATYSRSETGTSSQIDVNVTAIKGLGQPDPQLIAFGENMPGIILRQNTAQPGHYYGQIGLNSDKVPAEINISDLNEVPSRIIPVNLADQVKITQASYTTTTRVLRIKAVTSDKRNSGSGKPDLFAFGSDGTEYGKLDATGFLAVTLNPSVPPAKVVVKSNKGGSAEYDVTYSKGGNTTKKLVTADDLDVDETLPINLLANDKTGTGQPITTPVVVRFAANPEFGTVEVNADQTITYTRTVSGEGDDSFTYFLTDAANSVVSNVARVTFHVENVNLRPIAKPDVATASVGKTILIDALANDTDPDGDTLVIDSVTNASGVAVGTVSVVDNKVRYVAPATVDNSPQTLNYTVSDGNGNTSTGIITVTLGLPETVAISTAEYRTSKGEWRIDGTNTPVEVGVVMTVYINNTELGATTTDALGAWSFRANSPLINGTVKVVSSHGAEATRILTIRN